MALNWSHFLPHFRMPIPAMIILLLIALAAMPAAEAFGGTNNLLDQMEKMAAELHQAGRFTDADQQQWKVTIRSLRKKVDERIQKEDSLNTLRDKDLYDEIDTYNKTLFNLYHQYFKSPNEAGKE